MEQVKKIKGLISSQLPSKGTLDQATIKNSIDLQGLVKELVGPVNGNTLDQEAKVFVL